MAFAGKRVFITGAGRGLGAALAVILADAGARLILTGRNAENLAVTAEAIRLRCGQRPETVALDLSDAGEVTRLAKRFRDQGEPIDILINNGAQWLPGRMDAHDALAISATIAGAVTGTLLLTRGLLPLLEASGCGDILNIVSISGLPNAGLGEASVAFYAAKHAQTGLTNGLRQELKGRSVRVSGIYPPSIDDISPLDAAAWQAERPKGSAVCNRDVVEAALFMLSRPRHMALASVVIDADTGGLH
ncbi:MAG: SDR family NAD(P)-dependent oxidoreductase [Alphaproteobacteria bacterium]|nr:SDR family NAD(P)-dependent oxidoreductase [Alphaproteobacteria bacterium]